MSSSKKYTIQNSPFIVPTTDGKLIEEHFGQASLPSKGQLNLLDLYIWNVLTKASCHITLTILIVLREYEIFSIKAERFRFVYKFLFHFFADCWRSR